jgi:hypothetical protein
VLAPVAGFDASDLLQNIAGVGGPLITGATYASGSDTLTLTTDETIENVLTLAGNYTGMTVLTNAVSLPDGTTNITLPGTVVTGLPLNNGTVAGLDGTFFQLLTGTGTATSLAFIGNNAIEGRFAAPSVTIGGTATAAGNVLDIEAAGSLVATAVDLQTYAEVDGPAARLTATGTFTLGGTIANATLYVLNGGSVQTGALELAGPLSPRIRVDPAGRMDIGPGGLAQDGQLAIAQNATLADNAPGTELDANVVVDGVLAIGSATQPSQGVNTSVVGSIIGTGTISIAQSGYLQVSNSVAGLAALNIGPDAGLKVNLDVAMPGTISLGAGAIASIGGTVSNAASIVLGAGASLSIGADANVPIVMGAGSTLQVGQTARITGPIIGFTEGDVIDVLDTSNVNTIITGAAYTPGAAGEGNVTLTADGVLLDTLTFQGDYASQQFLTNAAGLSRMTDLTLAPEIPCFLAGTRIATPRGEIPVEALRIGDTVLTARGEASPIVWIGSGRVALTPNARCAATPVLIRQGAIAGNVPNRDLRITKGHSLFIDGVLIPAEFLVNHRSIHWDDHARTVEFYHVELARHDLLVANGAPAESYRDDANRDLFHNREDRPHAPPQPPCAPVLTGGPVVDAAWRRLLDRAGSAPTPNLTDDPDLHLLADGRRIDAVWRSSTLHAFRLPPRTRDLRLASRAAAPAELGLSRDPRRLGVAIRQVRLWQGPNLHLLSAADPALTAGFHPYEPDANLRWTNGAARLPAAGRGDAVCELEVILAGTMHYPLPAEPDRSAA